MASTPSTSPCCPVGSDARPNPLQLPPAGSRLGPPLGEASLTALSPPHPLHTHWWEVYLHPSPTLMLWLLRWCTGAVAALAHREIPAPTWGVAQKGSTRVCPRKEEMTVSDRTVPWWVAEIGSWKMLPSDTFCHILWIQQSSKFDLNKEILCCW